jgi:hypothetical protein
MIQVTMNFDSVADAAAFFAPHATVKMPPAVSGPAAGQVLDGIMTNAETVADKMLDTAAAQLSNVTETKTYSDGTSATGTAPLPDKSPAQQDAADKKTRKPRAAKETPVTAEPASESAEVSYTIDDLRTALQGYVGRHSFADGQNLVKEFGASRLSDIKPEQYAEFIAKAGE